MAKSIMWVEGYDGQIELLPDRVVIHRRGFLNALWYGFNAKREIPLGAIAEVGFKEATSLRQGEIEFIRSGTSNTAKINHNRVKFPKKKNEEFGVFKEKVFTQLGTLNRASTKPS